MPKIQIFQDFGCKILNLQNIEYSRFSLQNIELAKIEPYDLSSNFKFSRFGLTNFELVKY